ncbi:MULTISPECIES: hypothetical protein [Enterococcus]|uniref:hypothetical protein n=1 Tax=Enterococcus TaxID=1350 RepID=UPI000B5A5226|nr:MULTISPECIES: hypothetical protein [Enterococcus]OTO14775.1 hypothetical protein A5875_003932 [Enterococcus sp. 3H8_DIV0648]
MMGRVMLGVFVFAIVFRVLIAVTMPIKIYMQAGYDDALSINQALSILDGKWLGTYGTGTLTKGLSFTFFLLVNHFSHLSYPLFLCLVNIGAAFAIVKALAPVIKNKYLSGLGFLFLIYSPATLTSDFSLRVYRNSLVFAAVLFVLAGILGLYLRRKETLKKRLPWSILVTIAFPFFWYLREDSIWLLPLYIVATFCTFFGIIVQDQPLGSSLKEGLDRIWQLLKAANKQKLVGNLLLLIAPLIFTLGESLLISKVNQNHYGIFTTNDRTKTSFAKLTENLIQIDNSGYDSEAVAENSGIWVSKKTFAEAQKVSPTFAKYRKGIEWIWNESIWPDAWPVKNDELPGDMFVWALREMFKQEGLYKDGAANEKVFKKINQELEEGFKSGELKKKKMFFVSKQSNGKKLEDMGKVFSYMGAGILETTLYKSYQTSYGGSIFMPDQPAEVVLDLLNVKSVSTLKSGMAAESKRTRLTVWIITGIIWIYRIVSPVLLLVSLGAMVIFTAGYIKNKKTRKVLADYLIIFLGLLLTYLVYLFGVSWFATWAPNGKGLFMFFYTGAGVPLIQVIELLGVALVVRNVQNKLFEDKVSLN